MAVSIDRSPVTASNVDEALRLIETVVPPRPSLREAMLDENAIDSIVVSPEVQARDVGSLVVRFASATLARRGHEVVSLLTGDTNLPTVRLYERHGFRRHAINRWFRRAVGATHAQVEALG